LANINRSSGKFESTLYSMDYESIRTFCLHLPGVTEEVKWGTDCCFCIGGKLFCVLDTRGGFSVVLKSTSETFAELCERVDVAPAPYSGRNKWVSIGNPAALSDGEWESLIRTSYGLISMRLSKKVRQELGLV
jgi:predicted DNA-binding protein (MmcQ/YjbR family)